MSESASKQQLTLVTVIMVVFFIYLAVLIFALATRFDKIDSISPCVKQEGMMARKPRCEVCGEEIVESLIEVGTANPWICVECSGLSLSDLYDLSAEEMADSEVHLLRQFHGKD